MFHDVEAEHYDLGGADPNAADIWIVGRDLAGFSWSSWRRSYLK